MPPLVTSAPAVCASAPGTNGLTLVAAFVERESFQPVLRCFQAGELDLLLIELRAELEAHAIRQALQRTGGNKLAAARLLGISRATLYLKLALVGAAEAAPHNAAQPQGD